jgi:RNA polymerase sigma-70 factor (ECF subfamily)
MSSPVPTPRSDLDLAHRLAEQLAVERVRQGDAFALEMIFTAYRGELLELAHRITGRREVAEDVVQDVFLAVWRGRERWHITTSLRAYLRRAVQNGALRSSSTRTVVPGGLELGEVERVAPGALADHSAAPDARVEQAELTAAVAEATARMTPRAREVFTLKRLQHLSTREIAERLGLSPKTVEIHMTRALAALRQRLADWHK